MDTAHPHVVRITTVVGNRFVLEDARLMGDSIGGTAIWEDQAPAQRGFTVAVQDVERIEWRTGGRGVGPDILGLVKGTAIMVGAITLLVVVALTAL